MREADLHRWADRTVRELLTKLQRLIAKGVRL
jgi:hypothetical protein